MEDENPAWEISQEEVVVRRLQEAVVKTTGREAFYGGMPSWTDATYLFLRGIKSVVFGAGGFSFGTFFSRSGKYRGIGTLSGNFLSFLG